MYKTVLFVLAILLFVQCAKENNLIQKGALGDINHKTTIEELDQIFKNDSVEKFLGGGDLIREYRVFDTDGEIKLIVMPRIENDSIKSLELIKIYSSLFETEKGISTASAFKQVADLYSIDKIEPSFSSAILFINEINATISLNKKDLNIDEFDMRDIRKDQIPDMASILYITLWLE